MNVLHAHYTPGDPGLFFWAETPDVAAPTMSRGRAAQNPRPKAHPFCVVPDQPGEKRTLTLQLPAVRGIPLPSPQLVHNWDITGEGPALAPFLVEGSFTHLKRRWPFCWLLPRSQPDSPGALRSLTGLSLLGMMRLLWYLETLAAHKLVPVMEGQDARWLPVLDSSRKTPRGCRNLPPLCPRFAAPASPEVSPRNLLTSFLNTFCDSLARAWGKPAAPKFYPQARGYPAYRWLEALFSENSAIKLDPQRRCRSCLQPACLDAQLARRRRRGFSHRLSGWNRPALQNQPWQLHYLIQAKDDPSLLIPADEVWKKTKGALTHLGHRFEQPQEKLLAGLGYAARLFPPVTESLKSKRPTELAVDTSGAYTFLRETAPLLEGAGFGILVPPWWNKKGARLGVKVKMKSKNDEGRAKQDDDGEPGQITSGNSRLGETELTDAEFKALAKLKSPLVQIRGQWVTLDAEQIEAAIKFWEKHQLEGEMCLLEAMRLGLGGETSAGGLPIDGVESEGWLTNGWKSSRKPKNSNNCHSPKAWMAQLRPYQQYGYSWLAFFRQWGMGACLADDMGLGKTIQTISLLLNEKETKRKLSAPVLLIAPTSVVTNWEREIGRFAPGLKTYIHRGATG